ncbi:MAG TPA: LLM class F420-dependent oxidoreductase [Mycobacteriales bacterium]|jgi:probable F420-dependent oxidoreductase|nr:LLM class F420-dependent oxidoreductase [Mycobacteriales bacterium]
MGYGFHLPFDDVALRDCKPLLDEVARLGYSEVWSAEATGQDGLTPLALAAAWQPALRVGVAILPAYTRGPALMAMSAAAMADASPGGFSLGIGASSQPIVESWNAIEYDRPYARVRDTVRFLRQALTGERVEQEYETFTVRGFRMDRPPVELPTFLIAALRPQMLRLAGREADGTILNWLSAGDIPTVAREVGPDRQLVTKVLLCLEPDETFLPMIRRMVAAYLNVEGYAKYQQWLGRGELLAPMWEAWAAGDRRAALEAIPDALIEELFVFGSAAECRAGIAKYVDAGVTTPIICPVGGGASAADTMRALAP